MSWLNGYAEKVYMRVLKIGTRVRFLRAVGKFVDNVRIVDATDLWCFAMEHCKQTKDTEPSTTIEKDTGTYASREQLFREDTETLIAFTLHPSAARCYVVIQKSQRFNAMTDRAKACLYLLKACYTPFSHAFADASQAHVVMRSNNQLQVTGRVISPYLKGDSEPPLDPATPTPPPFGDNIGDPQLPAALQGASSAEASAQPPSQQPPYAPTPIRRLPPIDRWAPQAANGTLQPTQSVYANPPLPAPLPEPPPAKPPGHQPRVKPMVIPATFRVTPSTAATPTPVAAPTDALVSRLLLLADLDDRVTPTPVPPRLRRLRRRLLHLHLPHHRELYATRPAQPEPASTVRAQTLLCGAT